MLKMKNKQKTILVTGGAGFIGSHLVDKLIEKGYRVIVVDDLSNGKKEYVTSKVKFYQIDICSSKIKDIFNNEKPDFVFHLAAQIDLRKSLDNPEFDNKVNILGGLNILENCIKNGVKKIIFSSSAGVYGDIEIIPTDEKCFTNPVSPYGINKLSYEKYLNYYYQVYGQKYIALRFSNVYGPRQFKGGECGVIANFIGNIVNNQESILHGDGSHTRDYIYIDDIVDALIVAMESDYVGVVNVGAEKEVSVLEVINSIEKALGSEFKYRCEEYKGGDVEKSCLDSKKAREVLGWWAKIDLDNGIKMTIDWSNKKWINREKKF